MNIDELDRRMLIELQGDGRMTNQQLSERVGLSPSPCLRRLKNLEGNVIKGYVALVDPASVGLGVTGFVRVRLDRQNDGYLAEFEQAVARFPEVMECYLMTGDADYQLRVVVRDLAAFENFLRQKLTKLVGVAQLTTSFALRPVIYKTALPI
ncbi:MULTISPECIES: Lrp/AsnC family transcriptional regulator [unclassified Sphingobium]|uniref:Lrp/AsnC family transcriptional regulator n=1 Tax=unclassified Sphingobium TaxID=2611147 RepID=UPI0035A6624C